jgi:hypothetical protein
MRWYAGSGRGSDIVIQGHGGEAKMMVLEGEGYGFAKRRGRKERVKELVERVFGTELVPKQE